MGLGRNYVDTAFIAYGKYYMLINGDNAETEDSIKGIIAKLGNAEIIIPYFGNRDKRSKSRKLISIFYFFFKVIFILNFVIFMLFLHFLKM